MKQKKFMKKLMMLMVAVMVCMIPAMVNAAEYVNSSVIEIKNNKTYILTGDGNGRDAEKLFYMPQIDKYTESGWKVKSQKVILSNKKVAETVPSMDNGISVSYKKAGTTKVTVKTVVAKKGKKDKTIIYKFTLKAQKFVSPAASLKVNGKEMASKIKKNTWGTVKANGKKKVKFTCKLKNGWKLLDKKYTVEYYTEDGYEYKAVKSGGLIDMTLYNGSKKSVTVYARVTNTKTKQIEDVVVEIRP